MHEVPADSFLPDADLQKPLSIFQLQISTDPFMRSLDLPHDIPVDRLREQLSGTSENGNKSKSIFLEGTFEPDLFAPSSENGFPEMETLQSNITSNASRLTKSMEPSRTMNASNKPDDSDPNNDDESDGKYRKRTGKGHQSKNLEAERKRRKKLNDRLYSLRALVPNISKLDRSAILGDAINYIKELQKQVEDLQIELEEHSDDENAMTIARNGVDNSKPLLTIQQNETKSGCKGKQDHKVENTNEKVQQMEPQVEVFQMDGNEFFVKVFCEHKSGGFVRLMEEFSSLGFQVIDVNATRHTCLVSSTFRVEKRDSETIQADRLKESLLQLARNPLRA